MRKTRRFWAICTFKYSKTDHFYQDRHGTNIGKWRFLAGFTQFKLRAEGRYDMQVPALDDMKCECALLQAEPSQPAPEPVLKQHLVRKICP